MDNIDEREDTTALGYMSEDDALKFDVPDDLYSSDADEADARWVKRQHRPADQCNHELEADDDSDQEQAGSARLDDKPPKLDTSAATSQFSGTPRKRGHDDLKPTIESDAQLSCPLCFTTVCLECQRHSKYLNQFRAVIGINISVNKEQELALDEIARPATRMSKKSGKPDSKDRKAGRSRGTGGNVDGSNQEVFRPVCCGVCDYLVGVMDDEEVIHFFSVIASA